MFKILDGREYFYQWDLNQKLIVEDDSINEVHFSNRTDGSSLVVEVDELRQASVPNILLQDYWDIRVYAYCSSGESKYTKVEEKFEVKKRSKPSDYVYTETEIKRYEDLEKRIDNITPESIGAISTPASAKVGQTIVVKEVNKEGVPTNWETKDFTGVPSYTENDAGKSLIISNENKKPEWIEQTYVDYSKAQELTDEQKAQARNNIGVPTALKNPSALTIKVGNTTISYDGSEAKTVEIADGSEVAY